MDKKFGKLLIVDGSYMLNRSLRIPNLFNLRSSNGQGTGGILQFLRSLQYEFKKTGMFFPVVCWDNGLSKRRTDCDPNYKHHAERVLNEHPLVREDPNDEWLYEYRNQRSILMELLTVLGIPSLIVKGWEGDDLIYLVSKMSQESIVLTDDRDMLQLISESCKVRRPMADESVDLEKFSEEFNCTVDEYVMVKAINGDHSDNIPGCCRGVGPVFASQVIKILKACDFDYSIFESEDKIKSLISGKSLDVKYRKAYLNFDKERFEKNLELVDLSKVDNDVDDYILSAIASEITNCNLKKDYFKALKMMSNLEINAVSVDEIVENVHRRFSNLGAIK